MLKVICTGFSLHYLQNVTKSWWSILIVQILTVASSSVILSPMLGLEMGSWTAFLVEVSGHKIRSSQKGAFDRFSNLIFPFYEMLFMNILEFSCFAGSLEVFLKPEKKKFSLKSASRRKGLWIEWSKRLQSFVKLMSKNSIKH